MQRCLILAQQCRHSFSTFFHSRHFSGASANSDNSDWKLYGRFEDSQHYDEYMTWHERMTQELKMGSGPHYFGGDRPFPHNPNFKAFPQLTDEFKSKLFMLWKSDPKLWTVRKLSQQFKVGMDRVVALLKLKALQTAFENIGYVSNQSYVLKMESHLNAQAPGMSDSDRRILNSRVHAKLIPTLAPDSEIDQESSGGKNFISREQIQSLHETVNSDLAENDIYGDFGRDDPSMDASRYFLEHTIQRDPYAASRWCYVIVNTSAKLQANEPRAYLRHPRGELCRARPMEAAREYQLAKPLILTEAKMKQLGILPKRR